MVGHGRPVDVRHARDIPVRGVLDDSLAALSDAGLGLRRGAATTYTGATVEARPPARASSRVAPAKAPSPALLPLVFWVHMHLGRNFAP